MSTHNLVVSATRLESFLPQVQQGGLEGTLETPGETAPTASDLADLTGADHIDPAPLTLAEQESIHLQYAAAIELLREAERNPGVMCATENQIAALLQSSLADRSGDEEQKLIRAAGGGLEAQFDERDVRWAFSLVSWVGKLNPHGWQPIPSEVDSLPDKCKIAVMGDWGTGLYGAPECSRSIEKEGGFQYIVHLGDVYYAGTKKETQANFLDRWPKVPGAISRACNGNHEMYSGGYGYFDVILPKFHQPSSCFAMRNKDWLVVGLDSAYADHDLFGEQNGWLSLLMEQSQGARVVLFTHHQPYSHFEHGGEKLVAKLLPLLITKKIAAWYWGHEHRCVVFDPHPRWGLHGRCIGHSGYPYFNKPSAGFARLTSPAPRRHASWRSLPANSERGAPPAKLLDGTNPSVANHASDYGPNGYLTLEFDGRDLIERYYLSDDTQPMLTQVI